MGGRVRAASNPSGLFERKGNETVVPALVLESMMVLQRRQRSTYDESVEVSVYCLFTLNLICEFQTFFTPKNCAKNNFLATSPYIGSSVLYSDVGIFVTGRLSHGEKRSEN